MSKYQITSILVDDEDKALEILEDLLRDFEEITIVDKVQNVDDAVKSITSNNPDLVFLDIQMPVKDGFDLIEEIRKYSISPDIIFITAYDEFAIRAFKYAAFDYLLKPIDKNDLRNTIERYKSKKAKDDFHVKVDLLLSKLKQSQKMKLPTAVGYLIVNIDEIVYCQAEGSYTEIHLNDERREIIAMTLSKVEKNLPTDVFFRISRSTLINVNYLKQIDRKSRICKLVFEDKSYKIKIARRHLYKLIQRL